MPTKKLIEVALPLEAINVASAREKSIRHGHPSTLHLWWSRKPLATCRAVLFASLVDDPSSHPEQFPTDIDQQRERERLFRIIEELVQWENSNNERVLGAARTEIMRSTGGNPPPIYDPFAGGGSIPLEAQRLGLEAHASDLNPVAVLTNKALIEIPPKFANMPPVNPIDRNRIGAEWKGTAGLAADVRYYGEWLRSEAERRIGHLYPRVKLTKEYGGGEATVIAWLWARTITCPNPACGVRMPLTSKWTLSNKKGKEAWVEPIVDRAMRTVRFEVRRGGGKPIEGTVNRKGAYCVVCNSSVPFDYVRVEGKAGRMAAQLIAIVAEGKGGRIFLPPDDMHEKVALSTQPSWVPETDLPAQALGFRVQNYGLTKHRDLFTSRQLVALTTFSTLVEEAHSNVQQDATIYGHSTKAYADAIATYLGMSISKAADLASTQCHWQPNPQHLKIAPSFARHAISMNWDYAEGNPFSDSSGNFWRQIELIVKVLDNLNASHPGKVKQQDAANFSNDTATKVVVSTDPPYYDNIPYADLSDFFYIWLRYALKEIYPDFLGTILVPKSQELIAEPFRHGGRFEAQVFFENGLSSTFARIHEVQRLDLPFTLYYAFKQAENDSDAEMAEDGTTHAHGGIGVRGERSTGIASTGWETMLEALNRTGFAITGTWPMRTERPGRLRETGSNALASSIVLVCRPRPNDAPATTRLDFIRALRRELPEALRHLQKGNIAPVDLAQAAIGPGMAIFSRHRAVLEADGTPMRVRTALQLINQALDEVLAEQEGEYDADTRWAIAWFDQYGVDEGPFGTAETLSKAKNTSVGGMVEAGIALARAGKVRLLKRDELPGEWNPAGDKRLTAWETVQHLVHALDKRGEQGAAELLARIPGDLADVARDLAYRLYATCERKKWAQEALAYNALVVAWPEIARLAMERSHDQPVQGHMFE